MRVCARATGEDRVTEDGPILTKATLRGRGSASSTGDQPWATAT